MKMKPSLYNIIVTLMLLGLAAWIWQLKREQNETPTQLQVNEQLLIKQRDSLQTIVNRTLPNIKADRDTVIIIKQTIYKDHEKNKQDFDRISNYTDIQRDSALRALRPIDDFRYYTDKRDSI